MNYITIEISLSSPRPSAPTVSSRRRPSVRLVSSGCVNLSSSIDLGGLKGCTCSVVGW